MRREETSTTLLMSLYFFLALASVSIVKSLQNALYLGRVGFDWRLPLLYVVLAVASGLGVVFFRTMARSYSRIWLNAGTLFALLASIPPFLFFLGQNATWIYPVFYIWGGIVSVLLPTQGWMLSYDLYTTREAKRLYSLLGTGGILGGAAGGGYVALAADKGVSTGWLLVHLGIVLLLMVLVLVGIRRQKKALSSNADQQPALPAKQKTEGQAVHPFKQILNSRYLRLMAGLILVSACATTIIDLQYKWALEEKFGRSEGEIAQFFGSLLGMIFIFSALFQLFLTSRLLRSLGIAVGLLILPVALALGTIPVVVMAAFWSVVGLKVIDGCLKTSVHRTSVELLYIPISDNRAVTTKGIIDLVVFRFGDALGAGLFFLVSALTSAPVQPVSVVVLAALLIWSYFAWQLGAEYLRTLRRSLEIKPTPGSRRAFQMKEAVAQKTLLKALTSSSAAKLRFALQQLILSLPGNDDPYPDFSDQSSDMVPSTFLNHTSSKAPRWLDSIVPLLDHEDQEVAAAALHLLVGYQSEPYLSHLTSKCSSSTLPDTLCLYYLQRYVDDPQDMLKPEDVVLWSRQARPEEAVLLARLMGKARHPAYLEILREWIKGSNRPLARAAMKSLGRYQSEDEMETLIQHLGENWSTRAARSALSFYGDRIIARLVKLLREPGVKVGVKREIPLILTSIKTTAAREALVSSLYLPDPVVSYRALKGLNKIRDTRDLSYGPTSFLPVLQIWAREYFELSNLGLLLGNPRSSAGRLLKKAVAERIERGVEKIFRGLELFLPPGDAYFSYLGYTSDKAGLRENAIELIDLRVKGELRQTLLPIFTSLSQQEMVEAGKQIFQLPSDLDEVLSDALFLADPWLKCCIIAAVRAENRLSLRERIEQACEDVHPVVRETAGWALETWPVASS